MYGNKHIIIEHVQAQRENYRSETECRQSLGIRYIIWIRNIYCCLRAAATAEICRKILAVLRKKTDRWIRNAKITNHITARMHCTGTVTYQSQQSAKAAVFLLALCRATGRNRTCSDSYAEFKPLEMFSIS